MHAVLEFLLKHGYWVLGAWVMAEQLGVPIPAVPILLAMGALTGIAAYSFPVALVAVLIPALAADSAWYALGRRNGHSVLKLLCRISIEPDSCVSSTRSWFNKLGGWALVVAKFVPGLSTVATPMAGLSRMPVWKFLSADAAGTLIWSSGFMAIGFVFREQLERVGEIAGRLGGSLAFVIAAAVGLWLGGKYWQRKRFIRSLRVARVTPEQVMAQLNDVFIVDLRSSTELEFDGTKIPGALWIDRKELAAHHEKIPR